MRKWFKKVFNETTQLKPQPITMLEYSTESDNSAQYSHYSDRDEQLNPGLRSTKLESTLNIPETNDISSNSTCVEYRTTIDESLGRITRRKPDRNENLFCDSSTSGQLRNYAPFRYLGIDEYKGITAYWNGTEGDAGFPKQYVQICVRVFDPNKRPPLCGNFIYRFLIGWEEDLKLLIDWLLVKENTTLDDVHIEYILYPGNVIKIRPGFTAKILQIQQNSILRFCHKFNLDSHLTINHEPD